MKWVYHPRKLLEVAFWWLLLSRHEILWTCATLHSLGLGVAARPAIMNVDAAQEHLASQFFSFMDINNGMCIKL